MTRRTVLLTFAFAFAFSLLMLLPSRFSLSLGEGRTLTTLDLRQAASQQLDGERGVMEKVYSELLEKQDGAAKRPFPGGVKKHARAIGVGG